MREFLAQGELVALRPFVSDDNTLLYEITRDPVLQRNLNFKDDNSYEAWLANEPPRTGLEFAIVSNAGGEPIGFVSLGALDDAELIVLLAPNCRGRGSGTQAARLMIDHGFSELGIAKIVGRAFAHNTASRRLLERLGFVRNPDRDKTECNNWGEGNVTELCYRLTKENWGG